MTDQFDELKEQLTRISENIGNIEKTNIKIENNINNNSKEIEKLNKVKNALIFSVLVAIFVPFIGGILFYERRLTKLETNIDGEIAKLNKTVEQKVKELDQLKIQVQVVNTRIDGFTNEFPIVGWNPYNGLQITPDPTNQKITLNGQFTSAVGYVKEQPSGFPFGGRILTLTIENSAQSSFDQNKMFKLEVNNQALIPLEQGRINNNDRSYINAGDGTVSFQLPEEVIKMNFVFWNANLNDLTISGILSDR